MAEEAAKNAEQPQGKRILPQGGSGTAKPTTKPAEPKPAATATAASDDGLPQKSFDCCIPDDRMAPRKTVQAATAGDAKEKYLAAIGAVKTEHAISAIEIVASGDQE